MIRLGVPSCQQDLQNLGTADGEVPSEEALILNSISGGDLDREGRKEWDQTPQA